MDKRSKQFVRISLMVFFIFLTLSFSMSLVVLLETATKSINRHLYFIIGVLVGTVVFWKFCRILYVWLHEHTHSIVSFMTSGKVQEIYISRHNGGYVSSSGLSNFIVTLAPYAIPLFPMFALLLRCIMLPTVFPVIDIISGFLYGQHFVSVFRDTRMHQPDLKQYGMPFSITFMICCNVFFVCITILLLNSAHYDAFIDLIFMSIQNILKIFYFIISLFI